MNLTPSAIRWKLRYLWKHTRIRATWAWSRLIGRTHWTVTVGGMSIKLGSQHPYHHWIARAMAKGTYDECNTFPLWRDMASGANTVLDCGAYNGIYALLADDKRLGQRIIACDMDMEAVRHIKMNVKLNLANIIVMGVPISDTSELITFHKHDGGTGGYITNEGSFIRAYMIDDIVKIHGCEPPFIIKLDVEGAELKALKGAEETIKKHHPTIFLELHKTFMPERYGTTPEELWKYILPFGYKRKLLDENKLTEHWLLEQKRYARNESHEQHGLVD